MKKLFILAGLVCLIGFSCDSPAASDPPVETPKAANIVLDGNLTMSMTDYGVPRFDGFVKNIGNATGYNCEVEITCYSDVAKTTIIDVAKGFPADLGDIPVGIRAAFDAEAFNLSSLSQIQGTSAKITWLSR